MKKNLNFAISTLALASLFFLQACDGGYRYGGGHRHGGGGHWGGHPGGGHRHGGGGHWGGHPGGGHRHGGGGHWGGHPGGGHRHGGGGHWGGRHLMESESSTVLTLIDQESDLTDPAPLLAQDYSIKLESALAFIQLASGQKTTEAAATMGVGLFDLTPLSKLQMPNSEIIDQIALTLGENRNTIEKLMSDFIADIQAENLEQGSDQK